MQYVGSRHPLAETNPLRSVPFLRSREEVFGPSPLQAAQTRLKQLRSYLSDLQEGVAYAYTTLGKANRMPKVSRRRWQANAMRNINQARARVRKLLTDIKAAELALLALAQ